MIQIFRLVEGSYYYYYYYYDLMEQVSGVSVGAA